MSSCSEWERLHQHAQSQRTDSGHSVHQCAAAGGGQRATGKCAAAQHPRCKYVWQKWTFCVVCSTQMILSSVSGNLIDEGQKWKDFRQTQIQFLLCICRGISNHDLLLDHEGVYTVTLKYIITSRHVLLHVKHRRVPIKNETTGKWATVVYEAGMCSHLAVFILNKSIKKTNPSPLPALSCFNFHSSPKHSHT